MIYIATNIDSSIKIIEFRCSLATGNQAPRHADSFDRHMWKNGPLWGAQWITAWLCDRMPPMQQVQSWHFLTTKHSTVDCWWYYNIVKVIENDVHTAQRSITADVQTSCGLQISLRTVRRERHEIGFNGWALHPCLTSPGAMQTIWCCGVKHGTTGL